MSLLINIQNNLDKTMNYIENIKYYCNHKEYKKKKFIEEVLKELGIVIDNLYLILKQLLDVHNCHLNISNSKIILKNVRELFIISDKGIEKLIYIDKFYNKLLYYDRKYDKKIENELSKVAEFLDDIYDELYQYIISI